MTDADDPEEPDDEGAVRDVVRVDGAEPTDDGEEHDDGSPLDREGVMDPDDLEIRGRDGVDETDDGRYVISTVAGRDDSEEPKQGTAPTTGRRAVADPAPGGDDSDVGSSVDTDGTTASTDLSGGGSAAGGLAGEGEPRGDARERGDDPLAAVAAELGALSSSHGFALAVAAGGETDTLRVASGDPTDTLATALRWYARRVNPDEPAEETVAALLADSDLGLDLD
ncbi:hypothetical protein ACFQFH_09385 [Halobaculum halobium]|uniref:Amphi-Trp domain-containing protein n=1 Tax=Halobaculum halobium TaxID=3032281 RepID=A0ABD5T9Q0_9EURY|nr:hypothetical protein [Halobaculum sp. SYNS20]